MGYDETDWIPCEIYGCECEAVDVHHIERRGMGGSKTKDTIENLMGLCRYHHDKYGDRKQYMDFLIQTHKKRLNERLNRSN